MQGVEDSVQYLISEIFWIIFICSLFSDAGGNWRYRIVEW